MVDEQYKPLDLGVILGHEDRVLCVIHPDPDSMASALALKYLARRKTASFDIATDIVIKRIENRNMARQLRLKMRLLKDVHISEYTKLVMVDGQPGHYPALAGMNFDLVIDHHPITGVEGVPHLDIRPGYGATSTIMEEYLRRAKMSIPRRLATALCYGIKTDTDNFEREFKRVDAEAFSRLFPLADFQVLRFIEQTEVLQKDLLYFDRAFHRLAVHRRRAVIHIGEAQSADIAVILADFFIRVSGIMFVVISCIVDDMLIMIFRSRSPRKGAGKIANRLFDDIGSAGGHTGAARAEIPLKNLPQSIKLYNPDSVEQFIQEKLSRPGTRKNK